MLLSQVEAMREQLRPSERKLADYVLEAPREVLDLAMTDFAARAGVSIHEWLDRLVRRQATADLAAKSREP